MAVPAQAKAIIETMLEFANLPRIDSSEQVQEIFRRGLPFAWARRWDWKGDVPPTAFRNDQRRVRRWLAGIESRDPRRKRRVAADVNKLLARTTHVVPRIDPQTLTVQAAYRTGGGVEEFLALGALSLFELRLLRRVRQCPYPGCGRYRVTFEGRVWNYHSVEHQREGERLKGRERVKRWRTLGPKRKRATEEGQT